MNATEMQARSEVVAVSQALDAAGLVPNKSGNVSCRIPEGFAITPAGIPYRELLPQHIVTVPLDAPAPTGASAGRRNP